MRFKHLTVFVMAASLAACTTNPYTGEREASNKARGAAIGAGIGAVLGVLTGDDSDERRKRALIGIGVGALAGTAVGAYMDAQEAKLRAQLHGRLGDRVGGVPKVERLGGIAPKTICRLGLPNDPAHGGHRLDGVAPGGSFAGQHDGIRAIENGIGDVRGLRPCRGRVGDH